MFERLLVAVDGSDSSLHALKQVLQLAQTGSMKVLVVSVVPPYEGELRLVGVKNIGSAMRGPYEKALLQSQRISQEYGVDTELILENGEPHEIVPAVADSEACDTIVLGVRGSNPVEAVVLGSMSARIIGHSNIRVLLVPKQTHIRLDRLLVAVDGSNLSTKAIHTALSIHESYGSTISILVVANVPDHLYGIAPIAAHSFVQQSRKVLNDSLKQIAFYEGQIDVEPLLREGDPAGTINEVARSRNMDLILIGSHGRTGLRRLLMGSVTERVIGHAPCPVLVATDYDKDGSF